MSMEGRVVRGGEENRAVSISDMPTTIAGSLGIAMLLSTKVKGLSNFRVL